jgi:diacylglycerol kinase family enzyme
MAEHESLGVVINPNAGFVRRRPGLIRAITAELPSGRVQVPESAGAVRRSLAALCRDGVGVVAIVGGDGTVTGTLTPLIEVWGEAGRSLPRVAFVPGGSVSTIPRALGGRVAPDRALHELARDGRRTRVRRLNVVQVDADGTPTRYGMVFGNGAVSRWLEEYYRPSSRGRAAAARLVVHSASSMAIHGPMSRRLFRPFDARLTVDGATVEESGLTALAAAGIRDIGLGFRPFHAAGCTPGEIHWIACSAGPWRMCYEMGRLGLRLPDALSIVQHASVSRVEVELSEPLSYTVDAELYAPVDRFAISAGPALDFVSS